MAATLRVQNTGAVAVGNTGNCSLVGVQSGDLIVLVFREENGNPMGTPSSDLDGNLTLAISRNGTSGAAHAAIWFRKNCQTGTHVITVPTNGGNTTYDWNASAWGGCVTTGTEDTENENGGSSTTTLNHGSITPSASALVIACLGCSPDNGGETPGADGMTALDINGSASAGRQYYQYKVSQTAAIDGDLTTSSSVTYDAVIAAFLETASSPVTIEPGVGSQPHTGQQVTCGLGIGMPDVP